MTISKRYPNKWTEEQITDYLDSCYPNEVITWFLFEEVDLYGLRDSDGNEFACLVDDDMLAESIKIFLVDHGGQYVSIPENNHTKEY